MYSAEKIREILVKSLPGASVQVIDTTGTGDHFDAQVTWDGFRGKSLVEQHQLVMAPLKEGLQGAIHALAIKTKTP